MTRGGTGIASGITRRRLDREEVLARRAEIRRDPPSAERRSALKAITSQLRSIDNRSERV